MWKKYTKRKRHPPKQATEQENKKYNIVFSIKIRTLMTEQITVLPKQDQNEPAKRNKNRKSKISSLKAGY